MFGVGAETLLPNEAYDLAVSDRVYAALAIRARAVLKSGATVVVDAVYDRTDRRTEIAAAAMEAGARLDGFWPAADPDLLRRRVANRRGGVSDATLEVLESQITRDAGPMAWQRLASSGSPADTFGEAHAILQGKSDVRALS